MKEAMTAAEIEAERLGETQARCAAQRAAREQAGIPLKRAVNKDTGKPSRWVDDVRECIVRLGTRQFTLSDLEQYHDELSDKHPNSNHVDAAVRHALQKLRDAGEVAFVDDAGSYIFIPAETPGATNAS